jgi:hypothetical protein
MLDHARRTAPPGRCRPSSGKARRSIEESKLPVVDPNEREPSRRESLLGQRPSSVAGAVREHRKIESKRIPLSAFQVARWDPVGSRRLCSARTRRLA